MPARKSTITVAALFALPVLISGVAFAADDPPTRVGRVSFLNGTVSFHTADQDQWSAASLNYPIIAGNSFWTEPASRAELEIGPVGLRMDGSTEADVTTLDEHTTEISVPQGHLAVHLAARPEGETYRILTPRGSVELSQAGDYEIDAGAERAPTRIVVTQGSAALAVAGAPVDLHPGDMAVVTGSDPGDYTIEAAQKIADTEWSRPQLAEAPTASSELPAPEQAVPQAAPQQQVLPPTVTGAQDLDRYGRWQQSPQYGQVWYPNQVASDWAPYRDGHWAWVAPWGWTWIDDEPWGFAPFHYGRWASIDGSWAWVPDGISYGGPAYVEPIYAPALVAFVGGAAWGASIGFGSAVGWIPLGPGERFHPGYHVSSRYDERVNVTRFTNIHNTTNVFVNRRGATVVRAGDLGGRRPFMGNRLHVSATQLGTAPRAASLNPLAPQQANRMRTAQAGTEAPRPHAASLPMRAATAAGPVARPAATPAAPQRDEHLPSFAAHTGQHVGAPGPAINHSHVAAAEPSVPSAPHPTASVPPMGMTTQTAPHSGAPGPAITHSAHTAFNQVPAVHPVPGPTTIRPQQSPAVNHTVQASANPAVASRAFTPTHAPQPHASVAPPASRPAVTTIHGDRPFAGQPTHQASPQSYHPAPVARAAVEPRPAAVPRPQMQSRPVSAPQSRPAPAPQHAAPPPARHDEKDKH